MDLEGGLIKRHRIYWGWYGVEKIKKSAVEKAFGNQAVREG
jgi:hypothetical protein